MMFCYGCNRDLSIVKFPKPGCVCRECLEKIEHQNVDVTDLNKLADEIGFLSSRKADISHFR